MSECDEVRGGHNNGRGSQGRGAIVPHSSNIGRGAMVLHPAVPVPAVDVVNQFQVLGQIPRPFNLVLADKPKSNDPFDICCPEPQPIKTSYHKSFSEYVPKYKENIFLVEPHMVEREDPVSLAIQYFPHGWHFIPHAPYKSLSYYTDILFQTESILIKPIYSRDDETKIIYHSLYIKKLILISDWGEHPSVLHLLHGQDNHFCYHDYIEAWHMILLYQNQTYNHAWFIQFDHKFNSKIPFWFITWLDRYGPTMSLLPEPLQDQVIYFSKTKFNPKYENIPILLQFISKYKIPWIFKWQYNLETPIFESTVQTSCSSQAIVNHYSQVKFVTRQFFIKWWDKFNIHTIIGQVQKEFPSIPNFAASISSLTIPFPGSIKEKGSTSGTKLKDKPSNTISPKSSKKKVSPSDSIDTQNIKSCSKAQLKEIARALCERLCEEENSSEDSDNSEQGSITSKDNQLFQDAQDSFT
ncbi:hypothetical protein LguiA_029345 [Lonicera macranthoides]